MLDACSLEWDLEGPAKTQAGRPPSGKNRGGCVVVKGGGVAVAMRAEPACGSGLLVPGSTCLYLQLAGSHDFWQVMVRPLTHTILKPSSAINLVTTDVYKQYMYTSPVRLVFL